MAAASALIVGLIFSGEWPLFDTEFLAATLLQLALQSSCDKAIAKIQHRCALWRPFRISYPAAAAFG